MAASETSGLAGMGVLDTPVPVVDLDVVARNIARLQQACDAAGVMNRPHIKTHKSIAVARMQVDAGAGGITCQKLGEAERMADAGFHDILLSYTLVGDAKAQRLAALARRIKLSVCCDSNIGALGLSRAMADSGATLSVLVECDTGRGRAGVDTAGQAVALAATITDLPGLRFAGLLTYGPNGGAEKTAAFVQDVRAGCDVRGLDFTVVSAGGTPGIADIGKTGETEYRAGTYVFNDRQMVGMGAATADDCALFVYATVVSRPNRNRALLDAGSKSLTSDLSGFKDFGMLVDYQGARIYQLAEEHAFVDLSACDRIPEVGDVVRVLPNHVCPVVNLFDQVLTVRYGQLAGSMTVDARGLVA